ncbi:hypothetical protein GH714_032902 [Hevea brasiliensis]|uniref:Plastocyanin-like domain-containing protein n=1 Tax=Hevea brasiliensis TaxID=3981 RepID=A0A6A6L567_HEVBR|nr:hypothetical protein GH714_032902 [Hevea brasiliensis]
MAFLGNHSSLELLLAASFILLASLAANGDEIFYEWRVAIDTKIKPVSADQPVITINGMFPGPLINAPQMTIFMNGIEQRLNSWQDGVSGTNCPIQTWEKLDLSVSVEGPNWELFLLPFSLFQKSGGGFGPIRVYNRIIISVPFPKPEAEYDLLIGDWYPKSYKMLLNGKGPYIDPSTKSYESFTFTPGKTYRLRISNVGNVWSFNFRIQNHKMLLVETEGSYTNQITFDSLDVHVGQSYSVLVTADQKAADYYIVATPKMVNVDKISSLAAIGVLHYANSTTNATDLFQLVEYDNRSCQAQPTRNLQVTNVTLSQTFILHGSKAEIDGVSSYTVNDVSYITPTTPLKLADHFGNWSGVFQLDQFSTNSSNGSPKHGVFVASGDHKGWIELVFMNDLDVMDSWHLDGFGFLLLGDWTNHSRSTYNIYDPVVRSTVQVYPKGWTGVYAYLDNPGMWNLRSQNLRNWYLGQELYLRVYDADPNPAKERPPPDNLLLCGSTPL